MSYFGLSKGSSLRVDSCRSNYLQKLQCIQPADFNESLELTGTFSWMPVTAEGGLLPEGEYDEQSFEARFDFQLSGIESRIETQLFMGQGSQQRGLKNG